MILRRAIQIYCAVLAFALALPVAGQESRGTISGAVTDPAGAAVVGAKVG